MKNRKFLLVMLAIALTFGLTMLGCGSGGDSDDGTFTLTGIPEKYNGKYAVFTGAEDTEDEDSDYMLIGAEKINDSKTGGTAVKIEGGKATLPMWKMTKDKSVEKYSGNDTVAATFDIYNEAAVSSETDEPIYTLSFKSITFKNGSASKTWADGKEGGLEEGDSDNNAVGGNTALDGTWIYINEETGENSGPPSMELVAQNGIFRVFVIISETTKIESYRGTYTISGNTVSIEFTQINSGALSGGSDNWVDYDDIPEGTDGIPPKTIDDGTIDGDSFSLSGLAGEHDTFNIVFIRQN